MTCGEVVFLLVFHQGHLTVISISTGNTGGRAVCQNRPVHVVKVLKKILCKHSNTPRLMTQNGQKFDDDMPILRDHNKSADANDIPRH